MSSASDGDLAAIAAMRQTAGAYCSQKRSAVTSGVSPTKSAAVDGQERNSMEA